MRQRKRLAVRSIDRASERLPQARRDMPGHPAKGRKIAMRGGVTPHPLSVTIVGSPDSAAVAHCCA